MPKIEAKLNAAALSSLGEDWLSTWDIGLPSWEETPGEINLPTLLWLYNLFEAWNMESYVKARYSSLGKVGHWFPGANADSLDVEITESALKEVLINSPWRDEIPTILRKLRNKVGVIRERRLWDS